VTAADEDANVCINNDCENPSLWPESGTVLITGGGTGKESTRAFIKYKIVKWKSHSLIFYLMYNIFHAIILRYWIGIREAVVGERI